MKKLAVLSGAIFSVAVANAGQITVANSDIKIDGALTTGYFASNNTGSSNHDSFKVSNFILGLSSDAKDGGIGFNVGFGTVLLPTVYDGGLVDNKAIINKSFGPIYAVLSYKPISSLTFDAGLLTTNIGYELATSFTNPNITYGAVWFAQPFIYPGARITYAVGDIKFYAEASKDKIYSDGDFAKIKSPSGRDLSLSGAYAVGSLGMLYGINYAISYYDYTAYKNLVDIVLSKSINDNLDVGINFDYQWLDSTAKDSGYDSKGYGVAGYIIPKFGNFSLPVRIEYVNGGSKGKESGIYNGASKAWTITATPTFRPTKNTYVRAEVSYVNSDNKIFADSSGNPKDTKVSAAAEFGFLF
ncbi:MAG TPA: porin [Sulfurihydrogenibium sp.]|uniref:outer membrane beta-barrel protein n=1 Tax=Sulfurihydrogenibium sp. (strain YO3AOP1) TaxID=436114 RepID=UPI0001750BD2|nr:outer membrane beta-barrel protein [Sulfurihydrogenibium sp. YO3AOP1]ACD65694.1 putative protein [Sulfurihydrogenibium sp. YO3AOP1]HBT98089.1 porin [Sulfurihydrogenibium sp.]